MKSFDELTSTEVNDLIATEIMGWHKGFHRYGEPQSLTDIGSDLDFVDPYETWIQPDGDGTGRHTRGSIYAECGSEVWNPYGDLNDCRLAEQRIRDLMRWREYTRSLESVVHGPFGDAGSEKWYLLHAPASKRCRAMLLSFNVPS